MAVRPNTLNRPQAHRFASRHQKPTKRKPTRWPLFAAAGVTTAVAAVVGLMMVGSGTPEPEPEPKPTSNEPPPIVYFADIPAQRTEPGQVVSFFATPEIQDGLDGVLYELGGPAPEGSSLDAETGEFYWLPPAGHESGRITLQLLAKRDGKTEAESVVFIDVRKPVIKADILKFENENITAGEPWSRKVSLFGQNTADAKVRFRLAGEPPEGLKLEPETGELTWTPMQTQVGPQPINI